MNRIGATAPGTVVPTGPPGPRGEPGPPGPAADIAALTEQVAGKADLAFAATAPYAAGTLPAAVRDLVVDAGTATIDGGNF